ncbi:phospholipid/cholesterol/gamma-HCH transport system permease protein [Rhizobium leguminosarum]|uniref:Phospholipid/cholesterol/gamma-HCH transport system permease protein n=1 Tax=Rhizobium leguminosarum TaxID=384 RepID=A0AAE2SWV3_RHILE|nr:phospholipid/cholesterol/gamma-HCH transport system permease protein [Rhizobium leguminosarum]MBB4431215.1 phospholipid/cholesterol/gamma-HCH transport system permease protein [Rhizobium esperanzae]MBB4296756.1 phospholipid/cholesterol/gamma-HCH transport system permease protein [Rhizobium leguminosarum]MBB4307983.1 phospholipid/cholesterol/gamma-HCH transport system permease protein [Rhizobium leguminosarum]MBB4415818.1 phospholipid/cholesterol/gamma-HCH transport system permease protein [R
MNAENRNAASLDVDDQADGSGQHVHLSGNWRSAYIHLVLRDFEKLLHQKTGDLTVDLSDISDIDTAGIWLLCRLKKEAEAAGRTVRFEGTNPHIDEMLAMFSEEPAKPEPEQQEKVSLVARIFAPVGRMTYDLWDNFAASMYILGSAVRGAQMKFGRGSGVSPASIVNQIDHMGVRAVPIILLMSFLIGAIIAQQGAFQLRYFGAEVFVVDLVGILQLREIGVLLTSIMIAGRSGSAITAEIGSMKMREEIDALKVMGLNPIGVLIFPRLVALTIALPLLTVLANFASLAGAAAVAWGYSGITFANFLSRLHEAVTLSTVLSGMIKAPFMALVIGIVAAVEGLKVGGSAESLGQHVTAAVVKAIFVVILMDGLFAMFYAAIDF